MILRHGQGCHILIRLFEELLCLTASANDGVDTDKGIGHELQHALHLGSEQSCVVFASHQSQYLVAAALQGYVEMWYKLLAVGTESQHLIGEQVRFYTRYAITLDAFHLIESPNQVDERLVGRFAEIAYVHPCDDYLLAARLRCLASLCYHTFYRPVAATSACERNGAVRAVIITSVLHLEEIARAVTIRA